MTFLGPLKSHRALHLWYRELLNVRPKERCILFLCANYLKSNKARKCIILKAVGTVLDCVPFSREKLSIKFNSKHLHHPLHSPHLIIYLIIHYCQALPLICSICTMPTEHYKRD